MEFFEPGWEGEVIGAGNGVLDRDGEVTWIALSAAGTGADDIDADTDIDADWKIVEESGAGLASGVPMVFATDGVRDAGNDSADCSRDGVCSCIRLGVKKDLEF